MIYLKIDGACGNQFFQYAFARMVQEKVGGELVIDYQYVRSLKTLWAGSDNLLEHFNVVPYRYVTKSENFKLIWLRILNFIKKRLKLHDYEKRTYRYFLWAARHLEWFGI